MYITDYPVLGNSVGYQPVADNWILTVPNTHGRYYMVEILDAYTNIHGRRGHRLRWAHLRTDRPWLEGQPARHHRRSPSRKRVPAGPVERVARRQTWHEITADSISTLAGTSVEADNVRIR
jgi:hypothetical protein